MRVISKKKLREFWESYPGSEQPLKAWYAEVKQDDCDWSTPAEVKAQYGSASILKDNRVVFNISGNNYRLLVSINYGYRVVYIRFVGTHAEYDDIDVEAI